MHVEVVSLVLVALIHRAHSLTLLSSVALFDQVTDCDGVVGRLGPQEDFRLLVFGQYSPLAGSCTIALTLRLLGGGHSWLGSREEALVHRLGGHFGATKIDTFLRSQPVLDTVLLRIEHNLVTTLVGHGFFVRLNASLGRLNSHS